MEYWKEGLALLFSRRKYAALFVLLFAILLPAYAVLTNILITNPLSLNPTIKPLETMLILTISVLAALGFTLGVFELELHAVSRKSVGGSVLGAGAGGSALAVFASACTVCQPVWLFWFGLGSVTAFLADYGIYILAASLAILLYSINAGLRAIVRGCAVRPNRRH